MVRRGYDLSILLHGGVRRDEVGQSLGYTGGEVARIQAPGTTTLYGYCREGLRSRNQVMLIINYYLFNFLQQQY